MLCKAIVDFKLRTEEAIELLGKDKQKKNQKAKELH